MNELEAVVYILLNDDNYVKNLINKLDLDVEKFKDIHNENYCTSVITGKISKTIREDVKRICGATTYKHKEINKEIGKTLYKKIKEILYE